MIGGALGTTYLGQRQAAAGAGSGSASPMFGSAGSLSVSRSTATAAAAQFAGSGSAQVASAVSVGSSAAFSSSGAVTTSAAPAFASAAGFSSFGSMVADDSTTRGNQRADFHQLAPGGTRLVYVSTTGSDSNAGTQAAPFATIQKAFNQAQAGDRILVSAGTYARANMYGKRGTAAKWITIEPVDDVALVTVDGSGQSDAGVLYFQQCSYVGVFGLEVKADRQSSSSNMSGVAFFRGVDHFAVWSCDIHDVPSGGINCFWLAPTKISETQTLPAGGHDLGDFRYNVVHGCANYDPNNSSAISVNGAVDSTSGATWSDGNAYRVVSNYLFDNQCLVPYTNGGYQFVTDGNGVSIDALSPTNDPSNIPAYEKPVLVDSNILTGNGGRGVHVYNSKNTTVSNNTAIGNLRTNSPAINGGADLDGLTNPGVVIKGNTILPRYTSNSVETGTPASGSSFTGNTILGGTQAVTSGNTDMRSAGYSYFRGPLEDRSLTQEQQHTAFNPAVTGGSASVNMTGSGSLTTTGSSSTSSSVAFSSAGGLTWTTSMAVTTPVGLSGGGSLSATGAPSTSAAVGFGSTGQMTAATTGAGMTTVPFTGTGSLSTSVSLSASGRAAFTSTGQISTNPAPGATAPAVFSGSGATTVQAASTVTAAATFTMNGALAAATDDAVSTVVSFAGSGTLTAVTSSQTEAGRNITVVVSMRDRRWGANVNIRRWEGAIR